MKRLILLLIAVVALSGCALTPDDSTVGNYESILKLEDWQVGHNYYTLNNEKNTFVYSTKNGKKTPVDFLFLSVDPQLLSDYEAALIAKGIKREDLEMIRGGQIKPGMSKAAIYAAWGSPDDIDYSHHATGDSFEFLIYGRGAYVNTQYVYLQNGAVTSISGRRK